MTHRPKAGVVGADELLTVLRATEFVPGSNLQGQRAGAPWTFLLPSMEVPRVAVLGRLDPPSERTLRRLAAEVVAVDAAPPSAGGHGASAGGSDLVVAVDPRAGDPAAVVRRAIDLMAPSGRLVVLGPRDRIRIAVDAAAKAGLAVRLRADVRPRSGELVAALSGGEPSVAALVDRLGLVPRRASAAVAVPRWLPRPLAPFARRGKRWGRRLIAAFHDRWRAGAPRHIAVLSGPTAHVGGRVKKAPHPGPDPLPDWLVDLAATAGLDLAGRPWAFIARGDYDSQKPVFVIADPAGEAPEIVVKVTRNPVWNGRLENERDALERLAALDRSWIRLAVPRALFAGTHAGLAVLGESALVGQPFERAAHGPDRDAAFDAAVDALIELGASTRRPSTGAAHAAAIAPFVERFLATWPLSRAEAAALRADLSAIDAVAELPAVMLHGDAGTWNLLRESDGRIAVLDWEASERAGPPLWDIERLVSGRAMLDRPAGRSVGAANRARRHLIDGSPLTPVLGAAVVRAADALSVPRDAIAPLVRLAWVARALKEVNRLRPTELDRGRHQRLVRESLAAADRADGWRTLTGL